MPEITQAEVMQYQGGEKVVVVTAAGELKVIPYNLLENYINDGENRLQELDAALTEKESHGTTKLSELTEALETILQESEARAASYTALNNTGQWSTGTVYSVNDLWSHDGNWYLVLEDYTSVATAAADISGGKVALFQAVIATDADVLEGVAGKVPDASQVRENYTLINDRYASNRKPRKLLSKLYANEVAPAPPKIINFGDSLSQTKFQNLSQQLNRAFGAETRSGNYSGGPVSGSAGEDLYMSGGTSLTEQYEYWHTGNLTSVEDGSSVTLVSGGSIPTFSNVKIYVITEPGGGVANLIVDSVTVDTVDTDTASGVTVMSYTQTKSKKSVEMSATGGDVKIILAHITNADTYGTDIYQANYFGRGGLLLSDGMEYAQARANLQTVLSDIDPDFITFEMDDGFGDDGSADEAFQRLKTIIDTSAPLADKLIIGSTPRAVSDEVKIRAGAYLQAQAYSSDASYLFFDSHRSMGTYDDMVSIFGSDDGVHPNNSAQAYAASMIWSYLNLDAHLFGYSQAPVNAPHKPSTLAKESRFLGPNGNTVEFSTDPSFGFDWDLKFPRSIRFTKTTGGESVIWQFSGNDVVLPNIEPLNLRFNSSDNVRSREIETSSGYEFTAYKKSDNQGGYMNLQVGLLRSSYTRAQLLSMNANALIGSLAFCSDCTGGAQWVYARGSGVTDWVTVDGKLAI